MKQYFIQTIANIRENPLVAFLTISGTALSVAMMMVLVLIYQVKIAFSSALLITIIIIVGGTSWPANRAASIQPVDALRDE